MSDATLRSYYLHDALEGEAARAFAAELERAAQALASAKRKGARIPRAVVRRARDLARAAREAARLEDVA